jgi:5'-nucleotidase
MSETLKPVALIDMDGVQANFDAIILERIGERYPHIPILDTRTNFYISEDYPDHRDTIRSLSDEEGFFDCLPLVEDTIAGFHRVIEYGFHPRICSAPISTNPFSKAEKLGWLTRHLVPEFGPRIVEEAIIDKRKYLYDGVVLIDDRSGIDGQERAPWKHVVFDRPYNQDSTAPFRLHGWLDPNLGNILEAARQQTAIL